MGSTIDRKPIAPPSDHRARNVAVMAGIGIILLFAVIGVVSAGVFVGGHVTSKSAAKPTPRAATRNPLAAQDLARARAQATQIVQAAQRNGKTQAARQAASARRQAAAIIAAARRRAASITSHASASTPPVSSPPVSTGSAGTYSASGSTSTGSTYSGSTTGTSGSSSSSYGSTGPTTASGTPPSASANLSNLPATWLVVAYNATFGSGPGSAGSVTVTNRSSKTFSGMAQVRYTHGGSAAASFAGLAPGQTLVLPLNGPVYPGGGYSIQVVNPH